MCPRSRLFTTFFNVTGLLSQNYEFLLFFFFFLGRDAAILWFFLFFFCQRRRSYALITGISGKGNKNKRIDTVVFAANEGGGGDGEEERATQNCWYVCWSFTRKKIAMFIHGKIANETNWFFEYTDFRKRKSITSIHTI